MNRLYISHDFPPGLRARIPALPKEARLRAFRWGVPVLSFMFFFPLCYSIWARLVLDDSFLFILISNLTLLLTFNLLDLLIVDWLIICWMTPKFIVAPGTEGDIGYKDFAFHFRGFLKGLVFVLVGSIIFTGIAELANVITDIIFPKITGILKKYSITRDWS